MSEAYTGLSFPLRLNSRGGLKLSTTSSMDFSHIKESIIQILKTSIGERPMELYFGSKLSTHVFDPTDESSFSLIKHEILECLHQLEPRIEVDTYDINVSGVVEDNGQSYLKISISFTVIKYNKRDYLEVSLGGN